ncbi:MAG: hypothetical protein IKO39_08715 [Treponema sp.]|nr:hypothetical protein [Treponema sp.]
MKRTLISIIASFTIFAQFALAQSAAAKKSNTQDYSKASVSIRFYDRTMYYPGSKEDNPIYVDVAITNKGTDTLRFKLADDRMFSLDFYAYTIKNTTLPNTKDLVIKRSTNQTVYFRELAIEPGETYSFVENVKDYIQIDEPSIYYLELRFYPELYKSRLTEIASNRLSLDIRPAPSASASSVLPVENKTTSLLKPEAISPDKVVEQTIIARQKTLWDQYFLYMDIEQMMVRNSEVNRKYKNASADERNRMLQSYKADLMQNRIDHDVVSIPEKFHIENTSYSQTEGTVSVLEWFKYPNFSEKKRYIYKVRQRDGIWQIYDYTVTNLGTE